MKEEFHYEEGKGFQQLYGWGTINVSVWLPGLSELVGTTGIQDSTGGCYFSAMQGLNTSVSYFADKQGGTQFAYFKQYNASGGGEKIWNACGGREWCWTRSSVSATMEHTWQITNAQQFDWALITASYAVHPAAGDKPRMENSL